MQRKDYDNGKVAGFINEKHTKSRVQKMKWDPANDRKLLLLALGREMSAKEYPIIAASFKEKPTAKAVQERYTKLRSEQMEKLKDLEIIDKSALTKIQDVRNIDLGEGEEEVDVGDDQDDNGTAGLSTPAVKKQRTSKKTKKTKTSTTVTDDNEGDEETIVVAPMKTETKEESFARRCASARKGYDEQLEAEKAGKGK